MARMAECDRLTGALSRSRFIELAEAEVARARRFGQALVLLMLDIDHLKRINNGHGHAAGDAVLREFVRAVGAELRQNDWLGRLGGAEFAVLMPQTEQAGGAAVAQRIVDAVRTREVLLSGPNGGADQRLTCTVSVGACLLTRTDTGLDDLLSRADHALDQAKHLGRCRVIWSAQPPAV
jgi:diguanylate cyclase (GGDEF)-like protein